MARRLTQKQLAEIIGRPTTFISDLIAGRRGLTAETALQLEAALSVPARFWMNLEAGYRLWREERAMSEALKEVRRRAETYDLTT